MLAITLIIVDKAQVFNQADLNSALYGTLMYITY